MRIELDLSYDGAVTGFCRVTGGRGSRRVVFTDTAPEHVLEGLRKMLDLAADERSGVGCFTPEEEAQLRHTAAALGAGE